MTRKYVLANSFLWASAVIASAIMHAPTPLTLLVLPTLATTAVILSPRRTMNPCAD
jgi:hypothetical protein